MRGLRSLPHARRCSNPRLSRVARCRATLPTAPPLTNHAWEWQGKKINYVTAGCGEPVVLVHGFGANVRHWRNNIPELAKQHKVYAIDLLGFGLSEKAACEYSVELWRDLVLDFTKEFVDSPFVLVGNSLGSLVSLAVAAKAGARVKGTVLLNCAGGMNNKARSEDIRLKLAYPIFVLLDYLLKSERLAGPLFRAFSQPTRIRGVLESLYVNKAAVDDELVELICSPALDEGALAVFVSVLTGPPGPRPEDLIDSIDGPILVLWGDRDYFTPLDGPVGMYFQKLPLQKTNSTFKLLTETGHCLHDDGPSQVHDALLPWLHAL